MALCTQREGAGDGAEKGIQHLKGNADKSQTRDMRKMTSGQKHYFSGTSAYCFIDDAH